MEESADKSNKTENRALIIGVTMVLVGVVFFAFGGADEDSPKVTIEEREFQVQNPQNPNLFFEQGEVKTLLPIEDKLIFARAQIEGRITGLPSAEEPVTVPVSFQTTAGDEVGTIITLGNSDKRISVLVADNGAIGQTQVWRAIQVSDITPLLHEGDPIRVEFYLKDIPEDILKQMLENPICAGEAQERCRERIEEVDLWYENNSLLIKGIQGNAVLPENHIIGAISELVIYGGK